MGDPQFAANPQMVERLNAANRVLDRFEDPSWLSWAEPARLMPMTQARIRRQLEERERRQRADVEVRQLAADRRRNEDGWKKREGGKKVARGSSKSGRTVERKGSKASGLGEDFSDSGSARRKSGTRNKVGGLEVRGEQSVGGDKEGTGTRALLPAVLVLLLAVPVTTMKCI